MADLINSRSHISQYHHASSTTRRVKEKKKRETNRGRWAGYRADMSPMCIIMGGMPDEKV